MFFLLALPLCAAPAPNGAPSLERPARVDPSSRVRVAAPAGDTARALLRSQLHWRDVDATTWVRGRDYKASFDAGGLTFVPFLGSDAERNYPVQFALAGATVAGVELPLTFDASPVREGTRVTIDRGAVREVYDVALDSIEQTFEIDERPIAGDLRIAVSVTSDLAQRVDDDGIAFSNERGGVRYGHAFVRDGDGTRSPVATRLADGGLEIVVPQDVLARSTFPLVVDPVISTFDAGVHATDDVHVDVAYDASLGVSFFVTEEIYSATDHDAWCTVQDDSGAYVETGYADYTTDDWDKPRVANYAAYDEFMVVSSVRLAAGGVRRIRATTWRPGTFGPQFDVAVSTDALINADIGGDPYPGPSWFLVVWQRVRSVTNHDIEYALVDGFGNVTFQTVIDGSAGTLDQLPRVSKSNATTFWNVAWQREVTPTDHDVYGASYGYDGSLALATHALSVDPTWDDRDPVITANLANGQRLVAFARTYGGQTWIRARGFTGTFGVGGVILPATVEHQAQPVIDTDGQRVFLGYAETYQSNEGDYDPYVVSLQWFDNGIWRNADVPQPLAYTYNQETRVALVAKTSGGGAGDVAIGGWVSASAPGLGNTRGAIYNGPSGGMVSGICAGDGSGGICPCNNFGNGGLGCANSLFSGGALLAAGGNASIAADTFQLQGSSMPNSSALYFQGDNVQASGAGVPFGDGLRCLGGSIVRLGTKLNTGNASIYPQGGDASVSTRGQVVIPGTRFYQVWYRNAAAYCSPSTFNLTNALQVLWIL